MPRMRAPRQAAVPDRPPAWKLLIRRLRRFRRAALMGGVAGLALLIGALLVRQAVSEGPNSLGSVRERLGRATAGLGLVVTNVVIEGRANTPEPLLRAALGISPGDPILGFSVAAARARVESLSWVASAAVERRLPGTVVVALTERRPYAIWQREGRFVLIDRQGQTVEGEDVAHFRDLPLVVGAGAPARAEALLDALAKHPKLAAHVVAAVRVAERRWNLHLASGTDVLLPEDHEAAALDRLDSFEAAHGLLERPLQTVDLRLPDRLVLRPRATETPSETPPRPTRRPT